MRINLIYSTVWKGRKENQEYTNGDYCLSIEYYDSVKEQLSNSYSSILYTKAMAVVGSNPGQGIYKLEDWID